MLTRLRYARRCSVIVYLQHQGDDGAQSPITAGAFIAIIVPPSCSRAKDFVAVFVLVKG